MSGRGASHYCRRSRAKQGQLGGSIHLGLSCAISDELVMENGLAKSTILRRCVILCAKDMPEVKVIEEECLDPYGPYGAKSVGGRPLLGRRSSDIGLPSTSSVINDQKTPCLPRSNKAGLYPRQM
jgi:hypothetical protein